MISALLKYLLCVCLFVGLSYTALYAQILPPPPPGNGGGANVPLDPASWVVLAAGGAYAYRRYRNQKDHSEDI